MSTNLSLNHLIHYGEMLYRIEKSPPLPLFFTVYLVNLVKLSDAQLPRQSRETIWCSAASLISWNYPMLSRAASTISWNYPILSCLVNFVKLSDAQLPHQSRGTIRYSAEPPHQSHETIRCSATSSVSWSETIRCSAASSILWTIRCSGALSVSWNYPMLNCLVKSRETIRCSAASSISLNYTMLSQKSRRYQEHTAKTNYSQKWNCKASFTIPTFMDLSAIYIFPFPTIGLHIFAAAK